MSSKSDNIEFYDISRSDICKFIKDDVFDKFFSDYEPFYSDSEEWKVYKIYCQNDDNLLKSLTGEDKYDHFHDLIIERMKYLQKRVHEHPTRQQMININNEMSCRAFTLERYYQNMFMKLIILDKSADWSGCRKLIDEINELFRLRLLTPYGYGKQFEHLGRILACFNDLNSMTPEQLKDVLSNYKIEMKQGPEEFVKNMIQNMNDMFIKFMDRDKEESNECSRLIHYANEHALYGCPVRDIILAKQSSAEYLRSWTRTPNTSQKPKHWTRKRTTTAL